MAEGMQSLNRALDILEELAGTPKGRSVSEISKKLELNKSTVHRILQTLLQRGYVEQDSRSKDYKIGLRVVDLGSGYLNSLHLREEAHPFLEKLHRETSCIIHLAILDDREVVYVDKVSEHNSIQLYSELGKRAYIHSTGLGKAFLSAMTNDRALYYVSKNGFIQRTTKTISNKVDLLKDLEKARKRGYTIDDEENEYGIKCVAAPIYDYRGDLAAAVSAVNSRKLMTSEKTKQYGKLVCQCAAQISERMGYHG